MEELNIEKFNPAAAELRVMVEKTKGVTATDLKDKDQLKIVKTARIELRDTRVAIAKKGKELREGALDFQRQVIAKEKELIAIIEPEESRLKSIEEEAERLAEIERRKEIMPRRMEILKGIGVEITEAEVLEMDDDQFVEFKNQKTEEKNEAERLRLEGEKKKIEEEKDRLAREDEMRKREEKARKEERERADREAKEKEERRIREEKEKSEREAREKKEAEDRAAKEKEEAERKEAEERERIESQKRYKAFREKHGWTEGTKGEYREEKVGNEIVLWKKLGTFKIK